MLAYSNAHKHIHYIQSHTPVYASNRLYALLFSILIANTMIIMLGLVRFFLFHSHEKNIVVRVSSVRLTSGFRFKIWVVSGELNSDQRHQSHHWKPRWHASHSPLLFLYLYCCCCCCCRRLRALPLQQFCPSHVQQVFTSQGILCSPNICQLKIIPIWSSVYTCTDFTWWTVFFQRQDKVIMKW